MKIVKAAVVLLVGLLLVTAFACGGGSKQGSAPAGWATYSNSSLGFIIQYPSDWTKREKENGVNFYREVQSAPAVVLVGCYDAETSALTDDFINKCIIALKSAYPDASISESGATTLGNMSAHKFCYTLNSDSFLMTTMEIHTIKDEKDYIVTYMAPSETYERNIEVVQQMIDSFRFD